MTALRKILKILLTAVLLALCAALCFQAVDIYRLGNAPENFSAPGVRIEPVYSRQIAGDRLAALLPLFWSAGVLAAAGLILEAAAGKREKGRALRSPEEILRRMKSRVSALPEEALREEKGRKRAYVGALAVSAVCLILSLWYLLDGRNFAGTDLEHTVGQLLLWVGPWVGLALAAWIAAVLYGGKSAEREIALLKTLPREQEAPPAPKGPGRGRTYLRLALYALGIVLVAAGAANGGLRDVLVKAINICTECIGLG